MRLRVVDGCHEVACGSSLDAALDDLPGRHQVAEGDETQVVAYGSTKQGGGFLESGDAWKDFNIDVHTLRFSFLTSHLKDERRHAIDACIA